jgi:hypothetical protein
MWSHEGREELALLHTIDAKLDSLILTVQKGFANMAAGQSALDSQIAQLTASVTAQSTVVGSVSTLLNSIPSLIATAVQTALAAGATPEELASLTALGTTIQQNTATLSQAVISGTPAATSANPPTPAPAASPSALKA